MKKTDNQNYNLSVKRLSDWLYQNELERRRWSHEYWQHPGGRAFNISKILIPILSAASIMSVILYCLIRDMQVSMTAEGSLAYEADTKNVQLYFALVLSMCGVIMVGNILLFLKKYIVGCVSTAVATVVVLGHIFTQINIPMPPDPVSDYKIFCWVSIAMYFALILCCVAIVFILLYDKHELNRMVENTLIKIAGSQKQDTMLDLDTYAQMIDKYIDVEKEKQQSRQKNNKNKK
ncbi:MAG: hypothetical protein IJF54_05790 [Clostridia bacterium]|nr:hypothetical protein [Clostridia bacterium]